MQDIPFQDIRNIIFDLGGVIIDIDFACSIASFKQLAPESMHSHIHQQTYKAPVFIAYEKGQLSDDEFRQTLQNQFKITGSKFELDQAWNSILGSIPVERIKTLQQLQATHRTFLLSNTNAIHVEGVEAILYAQHQITTLAHLFEKVYYSHLIKMRKPDPDPYRLILEENQLKPEETLFLDDNADNVTAAQRIGIHALRITANTNQIVNLAAHLNAK
jgi:putative hydrolase of the HAD superfamily